MIEEIAYKIEALDAMKSVPEKLYAIGNQALLKRRVISMVGTRRPSAYTKTYTSQIAKEFSLRGICIVSGAAMGVDALSHKAAGFDNTIAVMANGLDIRYPNVNKALIEKIEEEGLTLSQFPPKQKASPWSFVQRNEIVVALGEALVVTEADLNSGSMRSVEFALKMKKPIYVLPHQINQSRGTNELLQKGLAKAIYDVKEFADSFKAVEKTEDKLLEFCESHPPLQEAIERFGDKVYEYELLGKIKIQNAKVMPS